MTESKVSFKIFKIYVQKSVFDLDTPLFFNSISGYYDRLFYVKNVSCRVPYHPLKLVNHFLALKTKYGIIIFRKIQTTFLSYSVREMKERRKNIFNTHIHKHFYF